MGRINYSEHQSFRQVVWIWCIIIPIAFISSASVLYGFYQQIILGEVWGNEPMNDGGLIAVTLLVIITQAGIVWFVSSITLSLEITNEELRYKFFTYFTDWNTLKTYQIIDYSLEKYTFWKGRGLGYRKDIVNKTVRMIIKPGYILTIKMKDGKTVMMSIDNKEEIERAMDKLMSTRENF